MIQEAKHRIALKKQPVSTSTQTMPTISTPTKLETRSTTIRASDKTSSAAVVATKIQGPTLKESATVSSINTDNDYENNHNNSVPADIAGAYTTMAYSATKTAHALTNALWHVANARATILDLNTIQ
jgi:hypothetical protein